MRGYSPSTFRTSFFLTTRTLWSPVGTHCASQSSRGSNWNSSMLLTITQAMPGSVGVEIWWWTNSWLAYILTVLTLSDVASHWRKKCLLNRFITVGKNHVTLVHLWSYWGITVNIYTHNTQLAVFSGYKLSLESPLLESQFPILVCVNTLITYSLWMVMSTLGIMFTMADWSVR